MTAVDLPPPVPEPCSECPWRRAAWAGHLGPFNAEGWVQAAHGDAAIFCHRTIHPPEGSDEAELDDPRLRQCAGAGIYRTNVLKLPRDRRVWTSDEPDHDLVFSTPTEFTAHHEPDCPTCGPAADPTCFVECACACHERGHL